MNPLTHSEQHQDGAPQRDDDQSLQGTVPPLASAAERNAAMDLAFDYRGDVTITTADHRTIEGYVFDRRSDVPEPYVRVMPSDGSARVGVKYADIVRLVFTGKDTAAGKSWQTWVNKYLEKKAKGEQASIESETLE